MYIPLTLNTKGKAHLKRELRELGIIDMRSQYLRHKILWDIDATIEDITDKISFQEFRKFDEGGNAGFHYEISNSELGKSGYGAELIHFDEDHIRWEKWEETDDI